MSKTPALTAATLAALLCVAPAASAADYGTNVLRDNPLFYWNFNESGSSNAVEQVRGDAIDDLIAQGTAGRATGYSGVLGNAAAFDGTLGGMYSVANAGGGAITGAGSRTWAIEFWFKVDGANAGSRSDYLYESVEFAANNPGIIYDFNYGAGDTNQLELFGGAGRTGAQSPAIADSEWHHAVLAFYGNQGGFGVTDRQDFWIDGQLAASASGNGFSSGLGVAAMYLGNANNGNNPFEGQMDEFAIYDIGARLNPLYATPAEREQNFEDLLADLAAHARIHIGDAVAATYTYDAAGIQPFAANPAYNDATGTELTDGVIGTNQYTSGPWVGFQDPSGLNGDNGVAQPMINFDLSAATNPLDLVEIVYLVDPSSGVDAPDRVVIEFFSDAGLTDLLATIESTGFINIDPNAGGNNGTIRSLMIDFANIVADYARVSFYSNQEWVFLGEITFHQALPAPAALPGGLALLAMAATRRRRNRGR